MNDLEREIRDTLRRHEHDAPTFDASDARRAAGRTRRRQILNVAGVGVGTLVVAVALVASLGGLVRADRSPIVLDTPSPSQTSAPTPGPIDRVVHGWPDGGRNPAGVYSWGALLVQDASHLAGRLPREEDRHVKNSGHAQRIQAGLG
jgi:hypothetical protein